MNGNLTKLTLNGLFLSNVESANNFCYFRILNKR